MAAPRDDAIVYFHRTGSADGQSVHIAGMVGALRRKGARVVMVEPGSAGRARENNVARAKQLLPKFMYEALECAYQAVEVVRLVRAMRGVRVRAVYQRANLYMLSAVFLKRWSRAPLLVEINAPLAQERGAEPGLAWPKLAGWSERALWRAADRALPVTRVLAERAAAAGAARSRITIVPNGVEGDFFKDAPSRDEAKRRLGLAGRTVIGFVGFVRPWHRAERLIDYLATAEGAADRHALIVGDGPSRDGLLRYARERGVQDRFTVTGVVAKAEVSTYLAAFDVAVLPDVVDYACPLKLIEYMAAGRAILAPDRANIRELLEPETEALLFDPANASQFAAMLTRLVNDEPLRNQLALNARAAFDRQSLYWDAHAATVLGLIAAEAG